MPLMVAVCDLCGSMPATTITLTDTTGSYAVDLCAEHLGALKANGVAPSAKSNGSAPKELMDESDLMSPKVVRAWAKENGLDVPDRGRIPGQVLLEYRAYLKE